MPLVQIVLRWPVPVGCPVARCPRRTASDTDGDQKETLSIAYLLSARFKDGPGGEKRRVQRENGKLQQRRKEKILGELMKKVKVWKDEWRGRRECRSERKKEIQEFEY